MEEIKLVHDLECLHNIQNYAQALTMYDVEDFEDITEIPEFEQLKEIQLMNPRARQSQKKRNSSKPAQVGNNVFRRQMAFSGKSGHHSLPILNKPGSRRVSAQTQSTNGGTFSSVKSSGVLK